MELQGSNGGLSSFLLFHWFKVAAQNKVVEQVDRLDVLICIVVTRLFRLCQLTQQLGWAQCFQIVEFTTKGQHKGLARPDLVAVFMHLEPAAGFQPFIPGPFPEPPSDPNQVSIFRRPDGLLVSIAESGEMRLELTQFVC